LFSRFLALGNAWAYNPDDNDGVSLQNGCACFSIVAGVWELAVGIPAIEHAQDSTETLAAVSLTGYGANETLERIEQVALNLNAKQTVEYIFGARIRVDARLRNRRSRSGRGRIECGDERNESDIAQPDSRRAWPHAFTR
jgi:hypothetical protein